MSEQSNPTGSAAAVEAGVAVPTDIAAIEAETVEQLGKGGSEPSAEEIASMSAEELAASEKAGEISKAVAEKMKRKLKLKVHGQEIEEEYDLSDDELLKREFQKAKAFDKNSKEYNDYQKNVNQMLKMLKENPDDILEKMGIDVDEWAEKRLTKKLEHMKKSPEQIKNEEMQSELEALRLEKKTADEAREQSEHERLKGQAMMQITEEISGALDKSKSFLPRKPKILQRVAETMVFAIKNGFPEVTAADVIPIVEKQFEQEMNELFGDAPESVIERLAGKGALDRYRKSIYQKNKAPVVPDKKVIDSGKSIDKEEEVMSAVEQRRRFNKMFR